ncbi:MAG TPA: hypothetical protein VIJ38_16180 [Acidobacteriaceae bacterium]
MRPELYGVWNMMLARCFNPRNKYYAYYGGRGIAVCRRWRRFRNFEADVGQRPPGATLERSDNAGDYKPGNVEWATPKAQARNRRSNVLITFQGRTQCLMDWTDELGLRYITVYMRMKRGCSFEEAIFRGRYKRS